MIRIGFWGPLSYKYNKEPQNSIGNYLGPYIMLFVIYLVLEVPVLAILLPAICTTVIRS